MTSTIPAVAILALTLSATPADAADAATIATLTDRSDTPSPSPIVWESVVWGDYRQSRPSALAALYVSYVALQTYDIYSTRRALAHGAREANPFMQGVVGNTPGFIAVKAGAGIATLMASERLWRTNKAAAIAVMLAANSVSAAVAARNALTLRRLASSASRP